MQKFRPENVKVLIIGFGSIGKRHADILSGPPFYAEINLVTKQIINNYKCYSSINDIQHLDKYDYFIISNETHLHYATLIDLDSKLHDKKIMIEKPLIIEEDMKSFNNQIYIGYNLRFHPIIDFFKKVLVNEKIININIYTGQYLPSWRPNRDYREIYSAKREKLGGVLNDLSHEIDYLFYLSGELKSYNSNLEKISNLEIDSEDYFSLIGKTKNEVAVNITLDYICKIPQRRILINTYNSTYVGDLINGTLFKAENYNQIEKIEIEFPNRDLTYLKMHEDILTRLKPICCNLDEARKISTFLKNINLNKDL